MSFFQALFLALVQGVTEFLPISSSGHLVLFQKLFRLSDPPVLFDVLLHLGSLGAILVYFRREIIFLFKEWRSQLKFWSLLIIGSIPAAFFGFFLSGRLEGIFNSLALVGIMWIVFGSTLLFSRLIKAGSKSLEKKNLGSLDALVVGLFQAAALFPGISRSGSTIIGGRMREFSSGTAFTFSFLLAIPAILGAVALELQDGRMTVGLADLSAMVVAGVVGFLSLRFLQQILKSDKFYLFGYYCLGIGILTIYFGFKY